jgi:integrase/recombinase XerD
VTGLRQAAEEYLAIRRALGFQLVNQGRLLMEFVDYLEHAETTRLTTTMAVAWARQPAQADPSWWGQRLSVVRGFAQHLHAHRPDLRGACGGHPARAV